MAKAKVYNFDGIEFDSKEELEFYHWLIEAISVGYVEKFDYQQPSLELIEKKTYPVEKKLKTKTKIVEKHLLHPLKYTGDYSILFTERFFKDFPDCGLIRLRTYQAFSIHDTKTLWVNVDVKGSYNLKNHLRIFSLTQKVVYDKTGCYINMVVPEKFFNKTWVPENVAYMSNRIKPTRRKAYKNAPMLQDVFEV